MIDRADSTSPVDGRAKRPPPDRPAAIEAASAILIICGMVRLFAIALALIAPPDPARPIVSQVVVAETALQLATGLVGGVVRFGRGWLPAVNIVATLAFIGLLGPSVVSLAFAVLFSFAFVAIFLNKPWFDAMQAWRRLTPERRA